jgi:cell wall assembly regulator SMI1
MFHKKNVRRAMDTFNNYAEEIAKYVPGVHLLNPGISIDKIRSFETAFNVKLPQQYKEFLQLFNGGELFCPGTVLAKLYDVTEGTRKQGIPYLDDSFESARRAVGMQSNLLIIADTNYGDLICIELSQTAPNESGVIQWSHEEGGISQRWIDFTSWITVVLDEGQMMVNYDGTEK